MIHKDIKIDNIVVDQDFQPHIIDFGIQEAEHSAGEACLGFKGTRMYCAPEVFSDKVSTPHSQFKGCSVARDVWAMGIILYYLAYGSLPFSSNNKTEVDLINDITNKE